MSNSYAEDLAYIHDAGYGMTAAAAARELRRRLRKAGIRDGHIVSLGCGSGILLEDFVKHGFLATGIDVSAEMLEIARRRAPGARLEHDSYRNVRIPSCEAVTAIGEVLNYQFDEELKGLKTLKKLFRRVHASLPVGGILMFDLATPRRSTAEEEKTRWWDEEDWALMLKVSTDGKRLTRHIVAFRKLVNMYRRSQETHVLRLYRPQKVKRLLKQTGFRVKTVDRYDSFKLPTGLIGFIAQKRP